MSDDDLREAIAKVVNRRTWIDRNTGMIHHYEPDHAAYRIADAVLAVVNAHRAARCQRAGRCADLPPPATTPARIDPDKLAAANAVRSHQQENRGPK